MSTVSYTHLDVYKRQDLRSEGETLDGRGKIVYPGLINTHHHLYQTFSRNNPAVQNMELFDWLINLYEVWKHMDEDVVYYAALVGLADLVRHGATTVFDHHYVFNENSERFMDALFAAAKRIGVRLHASRGSMSVSYTHLVRERRSYLAQNMSTHMPP